MIPNHLILFDSQCNLCNGWSRFILRHDQHHQFTLCRAQSPAGQYLLRKLDQPLDNYLSMIYLVRGAHGWEPRFRSEAALDVIAQLPAPWRWMRVFGLLPVTLRDRIYDLVAQNRYRLFGRPPACRLPTTREQQWFLEEITDLQSHEFE
ncbi:thiol-disulfide oxidoreductase DCC family protein [Microbulbifer sp. SA54]|uniref:thiol-disulfide oxidoreductase DCC family protein n=1 Tax=Microbulbifer sp. SA54 TaxID=3401577 RepID=UPI003AAD98AB